jgi:hypothetical protein
MEFLIRDAELRLRNREDIGLVKKHHFWLVVSIPLKNDGVRQLGLLFFPKMNGKIIQSTNQIYIYILHTGYIWIPGIQKK